MENWDDLRYLVAVHKAGTMTGAARILGANVGTVSRRLDRLAGTLGLSPFHKTPEGWVPNPEIAGLVEAAEAFEGQIRTAMNRRRGPQGDPVLVRLRCPPVVSTMRLLPNLPGLQSAAPNLRLHIESSVNVNTLGDNDLIITTQLPEKGRLVAKSIGTVAFALFSGVEGNERGWVGLPEEFDEHPPMRMARAWFGGPPVFRLDNLAQVADTVAATGLAGPLPVEMGRARGFVPLDDNTHDLQLWLCFHETRRGDPVLAQVIDWIDRSISPRPITAA